MRNKRNADTMARLLRHARYEVLPTASTEDKVLAHVPRDLAVTVTASPGKGLEATLDLADGTTISAMALQGSDGRVARDGVRQLRALIDRGSSRHV